MGFQYKMSKEMYNTIKYPLYWDAKEQKWKKSKKAISAEEILEYVNSTFGLKRKVVEIVLI